MSVWRNEVFLLGLKTRLNYPYYVRRQYFAVLLLAVMLRSLAKNPATATYC